MFRHDCVSVNLKLETAPYTIQGGLEDSSAFVGYKQLAAVITAECDEMTLTAVMKTR
jgi:hypothetical protein